MQSQKLLSVTDTIAVYARKHARECVRRASGLVLTGYSEIAQRLCLKGYSVVHRTNAPPRTDRASGRSKPAAI